MSIWSHVMAHSSNLRCVISTWVEPKVEDHRPVGEPAAFGDVPHQPAGLQATADEPGESMPVDGGEGFGVVVPLGFITLDTEHDHPTSA